MTHGKKYFGIQKTIDSKILKIKLMIKKYITQRYVYFLKFYK